MALPLRELQIALTLLGVRVTSETASHSDQSLLVARLHRVAVGGTQQAVERRGRDDAGADVVRVLVALGDRGLLRVTSISKGNMVRVCSLTLPLG